jgi:hypothetical protein
MNRRQGADWKIPVQFEFTGRHTSQQNHLAEVGFATIAGRGRAMMSPAKLLNVIVKFFGGRPFKMQLIWMD